VVEGSVQPVCDPLEAGPAHTGVGCKLCVVAAARARCRRVTPNLEGPDGKPPSAGEAGKAAHEGWKRALTIVPILVGLLLLVLLIVAVVTSQSTT
jgi:cytochrome b561